MAGALQARRAAAARWRRRDWWRPPKKDAAPPADAGASPRQARRRQARRRRARRRRAAAAPALVAAAPGAAAVHARLAGHRASFEEAAARAPARNLTRSGARLACAGDWPPAAAGAERIALRTAHGTYLSAALDRDRVVQAPFLGPTELFERVELPDGKVRLRSFFGTCVSMWYDGTAHQSPKCDARETFVEEGLPEHSNPMVEASRRRVRAAGLATSLRTAHGTYISAWVDEQTIGHTKHKRNGHTRLAVQRVRAGGAAVGLRPHRARARPLGRRRARRWRRGGRVVPALGRGGGGRRGGAAAPSAVLRRICRDGGLGDPLQSGALERLRRRRRRPAVAAAGPSAALATRRRADCARGGLGEGAAPPRHRRRRVGRDAELAHAARAPRRLAPFGH